MADKKEATEYVVLVKDGTNTAWVELGTVKASSQAAAKRLGLATYHDIGGTVVAVPSRSWEPEELKPQLRFG